jgi:hypothetical protein
MKKSLYILDLTQASEKANLEDKVAATIETILATFPEGYFQSGHHDYEAELSQIISQLKQIGTNQDCLDFIRGVEKNFTDSELYCYWIETLAYYGKQVVDYSQGEDYIHFKLIRGKKC